MKTTKLKSIVLASIFLAGISFTSCEKNDPLTEDTPAPNIGLKFNTVTSPVLLKSTQQTKQLSFNSGYIRLSELEFEAEKDDDLYEIEFEIEIDTKIDFATGTTNPDISFIEIPAGTYDEIEVEIELYDEDNSPAIVLYGTYLDAEGVSHDVRFEYSSDETFEVEKEGSITFSENESALAQITFDPTVWFAEVQDAHLSNATKNNEGVIVISESYNEDIYDMVEEGLELASEIEFD